MDSVHKVASSVPTVLPLDNGDTITNHSDNSNTFSDHFASIAETTKKAWNIYINIFQTILWRKWYSQTCIRRPLLETLKSGHLGQVVILKNTFIKWPLSICICSWQVFSFFPLLIFLNIRLKYFMLLFILKVHIQKVR